MEGESFYLRSKKKAVYERVVISPIVYGSGENLGCVDDVTGEYI